MKLLSERLKWAMKQKSERDGIEIIDADIARAAKVSAAAASFWINGDNGISAPKARLIAAYLEVDALWLETGVENNKMTSIKSDESEGDLSVFPEKSLIKEKNDDVEIRQFDVKGSMGNGQLLLNGQQGIIKSWHVDHEWVHCNIKNYTAIENLCIVTGFGNSMQPMYNPGDPLLVDRGVSKVDIDGVYFFRVGDEGFIKSLQRIPGEGIVVISENKSFRDWTIKPDMDFQVLARVLTVWKGSHYF